MRDSWSISRRVSSGFLILTVMLVGLALFSHRSVGALGEGYSEYRYISRQNVAMAAFVEDIFEARIASLKYRSDPTDALRQEVLSNLDEVLNDTDFLKTFTDTPLRLREVERLTALAGQYRSNFVRVSELMATAALTRQEINQVNDALKEQITTIFASTVQTGNSASVVAAARSLQAAMNGIISSKQFFASMDPDDLSEFETQFASFERAFGQLKALNTQDAISQKIADLEAVLENYPEALQGHATARFSAEEIQQNILDQVGPEMQEGLDLLSAEIVARQDVIGPQGSAIVTRLQTVIPSVGIAATLAAILAAFVIGRWITGSVSRLADTTDQLAAGDTEVNISGAEYKHEMGRMARALIVFRDGQIERREASAERARMREEQDAVVSTMKQELAKLADGNLTTHIAESFSPEYEDLRTNFNEAVNALHIAIVKVTDATALIGSTTSESNTATNELSQRTENQAATLEETAAALDQLTASVKSAADHAKSVDASVVKARSEATKNGEIVAQAVSAMGEIERSSNQITQVIGVIDDIAFQTNLLALNAGVEAARAGESGRGFAVVASEVRALAQRSADAAKEISSLISKSSRHVQQGTQLVGNAGDALSEIINQVNDISDMTSQIATSAEEQAIGLSEINIGVNQLDQATQQNAAMVQDSISRGDALAAEAHKLSALIKQFQIRANKTMHRPSRDDNDALASAIAQTHTDRNTPVASPKRVANAGKFDDTMWQDF